MKRAIIPLFIPHWGCPHQCVFCNQVRITGRSTSVTAQDIEKIIREYVPVRDDSRYWEAAFYGGSFTALPVKVMEELLKPAKQALDEGRIRSIRLSTRPDCITPGILRLLKRYGVQTVELGVQSLDPQVLKKAERGHTAEDARQAAALLRQNDFSVGLQFMIGLPGEDWKSMRYTARQGVRLKPDFIRIYPVLVLEGTALGKMYRAGTYRPIRLEEAVCKAAFMKRWYNHHGIGVIRVGLQATDELDTGHSLLAGPYHPAMGEMCDQYIARHVITPWIRRAAGPVEIVCSRRDRSKVMGRRRESWIFYEELMQGKGTITCRESTDIAVGTVRIYHGDKHVTVMIDENVPLEN